MKDEQSFSTTVDFRATRDGEEPNYLAYYDYHKKCYTCFAPDQETMDLLMSGSNSYGEVCQIVYEKGGKRVNNKLR